MRKLPLSLKVSGLKACNWPRLCSKAKEELTGRTLLFVLGVHARGGGVLSGSCHSLSRCLNTKTTGSSLVEPCCSYLAPTLEGEAS